MTLLKNAERLLAQANRQLQLTAQGKGFDSGVTAEKANDQTTSFTDVILHQGQQYLAKMTSLKTQLKFKNTEIDKIGKRREL